MAIISVSKSKENPMLSTVRMLRRKLRKAFFRTKLERVISNLGKTYYCSTAKCLGDVQHNRFRADQQPSTESSTESFFTRGNASADRQRSRLTFVTSAA